MRSKITQLYLVLSVIIGCSSKEDTITCVKMKIDDIVECKCNSDTTVSAYFYKETLGMIVWEQNDTIFDVRLTKGTPFINRIRLIKKSNNEKYFQLSYNNIGKLLSSSSHSEKLYEDIGRQLTGLNQFKYSVFHYLPNLKTTTLSYYFTVNSSGDTLPDFIYYQYNKKNKSYQIITDHEQFLDGYPYRDSMYIEYTEKSLKDVHFDNPENHEYYPNLSQHITNKIYNSLFITGIGDSSIIGVLWGFNNRESKFPYAYWKIIFTGDMMSRVYLFSQVADGVEKKYPIGRVDRIKFLKTKLKNFGIESKGNKIVLSSEIKDAISKAK